MSEMQSRPVARVLGNVRFQARKLGLISGVVGLTLALGSPARAAAPCPRLVALGASQPSGMTHSPGSAPLPSGQVFDLVRKGVLSPLRILPSSGPVPLTVEIRWWIPPVDNPLGIEFDANGDGVSEVTNSTYVPMSYTYPSLGQFQATVRVRNRHGGVTTYAMKVTVMPVAEFDAMLQERWTALKAALRNGDISAALECLHSESRSRYQEEFIALGSDLGRHVDQDLTSIRFLAHRRTAAIYEMPRMDAGQEISFEVRFMVDYDGVWRLRSF